jgi:hypothetical protein
MKKNSIFLGIEKGKSKLNYVEILSAPTQHGCHQENTTNA